MKEKTRYIVATIAVIILVVALIFLPGKESSYDLSKNSIEGIIQKITPGTDGYSVLVETKDGNYDATISIVNLGEKYSKEFGKIKVGEKIKIKGEILDMGENNPPLIVANHIEFDSEFNFNPEEDFSKATIVEINEDKITLVLGDIAEDFKYNGDLTNFKEGDYVLIKFTEADYGKSTLLEIKKDTERKDVYDFVSCEQAGGVIMESYPRQCAYTDMVFVENINNKEQACVFAGGTWITESNECEDISMEDCHNFDGKYNECASACRNDPNTEVCTMQCVQVCKFELPTELDKKDCEAKGGTYDKYGIAQIYQCNLPATDEGEECTSSEQCEGLCLADGTCSKDTINFGCHDILEDGKAVTICID